ncbi:MAG: winged helix-turn-helix transcriptional regulator [Gammaproteobacteria bacterium]|nr:winged helix-turn-helix transcriptional regulator [Gammaproteobacteria bacterium]MCP4091494.1 winged helix-turn-helix transcriptional regulator [Gammaproteobacteria bacterium]MCP4275404.1 winged helix-turn-helix transcriptional regulator [Gammaproteobacteria bacterium]MCP4832292.1 winged helix-turn-helix transcriptional regulator [Gammaproteobacteria bacterium]MCP4928133.1 winged helix-turn-helix transcriptional regulator [Gammaproteobacteria bacterium]
MAYEMLPYLLNRVTSRANQLWVTTLRDHGLTIGRWQVLSVLSRFDGSRIGTIADLSGGEQPAVSRVIDQMERDGVVTRRPALDDSRAVEVWITPLGRELTAELMPHAEAFVQRMLRTLKDAEIKQLTASLERLFSDLQEEE